MFEPYYAGKHQSDTYDSVKEQIVLYIQKNYTDSHRVVAILRHEDDSKEMPTKPTMKKVSYTDNEGKVVDEAERMRLGLEQEANKIEFREEL